MKINPTVLLNQRDLKIYREIMSGSEQQRKEKLSAKEKGQRSGKGPAILSKLLRNH